ncbi:MAG: SpoIID/LytB domain-containing protein [candidate division Zixibacteria bacterium]|nr:SpoIID/LytB domain-containing protein [candidate division Zixibacteria bacterium]
MNIDRIKTNLAKFSGVIFFILLIWGCGRVPRVDEGIPPASRLPFVRVLLDETSVKHKIHAEGGEIAIDCYKGTKRNSYYSRKPMIIQGEDSRLGLYDGSGHSLDYGFDRIVVSPRGKKKFLSTNKKKYRGLFEFTSSSGQAKLVNIVYVEDYLYGVVPLEIGPTPDNQIESVKAQAVAARTYAMSHLGQYGGAAGYDLRSDVMDQVYEGLSVENEKFNEAIRATKGMVAIYNDVMIDAYYHSTCGGTTDDIEDVWDKDAKPYLRMVHDDDACQISKYFTWKEYFTGEQLSLRIEQYLSRERGQDIRIGKLVDIRINSRTPGGRIASITFETTMGRYSFEREIVRWVVKRSDNTKSILRSANFTLDIKKNNKGEITQVTFDGHGYGHGVGMCQMGAKGLAGRGIAYDSILSLYYQGTELKRLY